MKKIKLTRKGIVTIAAVIGLVAVPSIVVANRDDSGSVNREAEVQQEDRRADVAQQDDNSDFTRETLMATDGTPVEIKNNTTITEESVTVDQALVIARTVFPDKTVEKVEVEIEHGTTVYSVRFTDGARVDVRARDGEIVRTKKENGKSSEHKNSGGDSDDSDNDSNSGSDNSGRDHPEDD